MTDLDKQIDEILEDIVFHPSDIEMDNERREYTKQALTTLITKREIELLDRLESEVQGIATSKPTVAYATSIPTNKVLYTVEAERAKLKERDDE